MKIISVALFCVAAFVATSVLAVGQMASTGPSNFALKRMPITVTAGDYEIVNQVLDVPPGAVIPNHFHSGPAVVSVVSGEITIKDDSGAHILTAGQSATEETGYHHLATNTGTSITRLSVSYLVPKGAALTTFVK